MAKKKLGSVKNTDEVVITACDLVSDVTGTLAVTSGGTGQTTYTNGQLLIGNTTGNTLAKATLTQGTGITITNGAGSITIASSMSGSDYVAKAGDNMTGVLELNESAQITAATTTDLGTATGNSVTIVTSYGSYASKSMSVSSQESEPFGVGISSDGTKCYVLGTTNATVYQYTLGTAWDISTGSYASKSMSVNSQEGDPTSVTFSGDGTKCYVIGYVNKTVYQYTLSTAWDISTGSYASKSMSGAGEDGGPVAVAFSSDGTKCYLSGNSSNTVYQYTLGTAWDISTGSYASKSMAVGAQDTSPYGLFFSPDGLTCFISGATGNKVYQYTLGTAWDISTGSYASKQTSTSGQTSDTTGLFFSSDGLKFYVIGNTNTTVYQYTLNAAWELSNISEAITSFGAASSLQSGTIIHCKASIPAGTLSLTHNATSMIIPGAANYTLTDGQMFDARKISDSSAYWEVLNLIPTVTPFARTILDDADAATVRATIGAASMTLGTPVTLSTGSPTSVDITGIPSGVKMIVVSLDQASASGTSEMMFQLGDSGGIETTGYRCTITSGSSGQTFTTGFGAQVASAATAVNNGSITLTLMDSSTNTWAASINFGRSDAVAVGTGGGTKALSGELTQIRLTTLGGANTFDAGTMNILYFK